MMRFYACVGAITAVLLLGLGDLGFAAICAGLSIFCWASRAHTLKGDWDAANVAMRRGKPLRTPEQVAEDFLRGRR